MSQRLLPVLMLALLAGSFVPSAGAAGACLLVDAACAEANATASPGVQVRVTSQALGSIEATCEAGVETLRCVDNLPEQRGCVSLICYHAHYYAGDMCRDNAIENVVGVSTCDDGDFGACVIAAGCPQIGRDGVGAACERSSGICAGIYVSPTASCQGLPGSAVFLRAPGVDKEIVCVQG